VADQLLDIAKNYEDSSLKQEDIFNIRADAADVMTRCGSQDQKQIAKELIEEIARQEEGNNMIGGNSYLNSQNIHNTKISESIEKNIIKLWEEYGSNAREFGEVYNDIKTTISNVITDEIQIKCAFKSLSRIAIDTATFTNYELTSAKIFGLMWDKIQSMGETEPGKAIVIQNRLIEELIEMADTCSRGHIGRLMNVFSGFNMGLDISISFLDQLKANISGRLQAQIKNISDDELKDRVILGMMPDAEKEDRNTYLEVVTGGLNTIKDDLFNEFVGDGYITEQEFNTIFSETTIKILEN
jgi:hypothetical protein